MSAPLMYVRVLTESWDFDIMHRRAGRDAAVPEKVSQHADAHKYCPLGRCGTRPGAYHERAHPALSSRSQKITAWRIAKAQANRRYLEERVYAQSKAE